MHDTQHTLAVANYFVKKSRYKVTPLQLVKLVYIAHGYTLAILKKPLFSEKVEAWKFGPVVPSVYHSFKHFGKTHITKLSKELCFTDDLLLEEVFFELDRGNEDYKYHVAIIDKVWSLYGEYSGFQLIDITHKKNSPWNGVYKEDKNHIEITNKKIKEYYMSLMGISE